MCISEIAVITGSDGRTVPLSEPGTVVVYRRERGTWLAERRLPFSLEADGGLAGLRTRTGELIAFLGECRTLVAQSASGALFFGLEKAGFSGVRDRREPFRIPQYGLAGCKGGAGGEKPRCPPVRISRPRSRSRPGNFTSPSARSRGNAPR